MKKCPFCAEEIQDDALKCRFCNEFLNKSGKPKEKWYFSTMVVVIALLSLGPLALPLVWIHPRYKRLTKVIISVIVLVLCVVSFVITRDLYLQLMSQFKALGI